MAETPLPSREQMQRKVDGRQIEWLDDDDDLWVLAKEWASGRLIDREAINYGVVTIDYEAAMKANGITLQDAVDIINPALGLGPDDGNPPWEAFDG